MAEVNTEKKEARAVLRYLRISPRKVSILCDQIRGKSVAESQKILALIPKAAADPLLRTVNSAAANAENKEMNTDQLYVAEVHADPGPIMKRFMPRAKGRAYGIKKRTTHITVVLKEKEAE